MQTSDTADSATKSIAILGTGHMARGIADLASATGLDTCVLGRSAASVDAAREAIEADRALAVRRKRIEADAAEAAATRLSFSTDLARAGETDVVIETIVEDAEAKAALFQAVAPHLRSDALVATNTSALRVADLAEHVPQPERFLGLHFMNPATTVKLVEIIPGPQTSDASLERAKALCKQLGKQTVVVRDAAGFVVNRLLMLLINEAARMIENGDATPSQIDKAMRLGCGHAMGPVSVADFIGLDTVCAELDELSAAFGTRYAPAEVLRELTRRGDLGRKSGKGLAAFKRGS